MSSHRATRNALLAVGSSALLLALSACGGDAQPAAGSGEAETYQVGYFPLVHTATAVHADQDGLFEAQGLDVELVQTQGGAAAIPALVSGSIDFAYTNYTSALLAVQQGLPIRLVAGNDVGDSDHGIFVAADSGIEDVADLQGKTFAVNNLQNIGTVAVNSLLRDAGLAPGDVKFIEMPYPDMQVALEKGVADAAWQVEPFQAGAEAAGFRKIGDMFDGSIADMPVAGWVTTEQFAQQNPEAVAAFQEAITASTEDLQGDREALVELVPTYTKVSAEVVEAIEMPRFAGELDQEQLQKAADLMQEYGIIDAPLDVAPLLAAK
ncbi:ABC transporter substrate-binding protein [Arthrobacter halodurans]|uniref:ABC transporter substrate-binding protein n=1 Tax=Arthrobacter halodurans TaxID=516699 RepID=A0ABV4UR08_9MICC